MNLTESSDSSTNQDCTYSADDLQRLLSVNGAGQWAQTFSWDPTRSGSTRRAEMAVDFRNSGLAPLLRHLSQ